jgi:hypothetical protein
MRKQSLPRDAMSACFLVAIAGLSETRSREP